MFESPLVSIDKDQTDNTDVTLGMETIESDEFKMDMNDGMSIEPMPSVTHTQGPEHI